MPEELLLATPPETAQDALPRYDLNQEEAHQLCHEFLTDPENDIPDGKFGCYAIDGNKGYSNLGRFVESTVFNETFNNTPEMMQAQYSQYDQASDFFLVVDKEAEMPVGAMRIIKDSPAGLKSLNDLNKVDTHYTKEDVIQGYGLDTQKCADIATLAVMQDYRGPKTGYLPSMLLYRAFYYQVIDNPTYDDHVITIVDEAAEKNLNILKFPFKPIFDDQEHFHYLDSQKSRALIAPKSLFVPQANFWIKKLRDDIAGRENTYEEFIANTIETLTTPGHLEPMLSDSVTERA